MFGAQTAKRFQNNDQKYQDDMKGSPNSGVRRKKQKAVKFQATFSSKKTRFSKPMLRIGRSWQRMTEFSNGRRKSSRITIFVMERRIQVTTTQWQVLDQRCLGWQECDGGIKKLKPSTHCPSQFSQEIQCHH